MLVVLYTCMQPSQHRIPKGAFVSWARQLLSVQLVNTEMYSRSGLIISMPTLHVVLSCCDSRHMHS